ncbi:MAG TPA: DNA repair protein RadC [Allosphingosinicella sp.]|nr:DNA repair protein RadC [Allosphingosinicella sp.]
MAPSEALGQVRCRQFLVELLSPLGPEASGWADLLVKEFGSLAAALAAEPSAQAKVLGDGTAAVRYLGTVRSAMLHALRTEAFAKPVLADSQALIDYLTLDMALLPTERLRVLFLNAGNRLLFDETLGEGSVSEAPVYPREIMRRALEVGATALILVHNHPSGDPAPSRGDIDATRRIAEAGRALDICIHDHVIVARSGWSSFRAMGLLQPARMAR